MGDGPGATCFVEVRDATDLVRLAWCLVVVRDATGLVRCASWGCDGKFLFAPHKKGVYEGTFTRYNEGRDPSLIDHMDQNVTPYQDRPPAPVAPPRLSSQDRLLAMIQKRWPEYHPIMSIVELAHDTQDEGLEFQCHKEVARYVVAVDKFVEVKSEVSTTRRVIVELFGGPEHSLDAASAGSTRVLGDTASVLDVTDVSDVIQRTADVSDVIQRTEDVAERRCVVETQDVSTVRESGPPDDDDRNESRHESLAEFNSMDRAPDRTRVIRDHHERRRKLVDVWGNPQGER